MNKGTAIVGFFLSFLAGLALMWGLDRAHGVGMGPDQAAATAGLDHSAAPVPVTAKDPIWGRPDAPVTIVEISDFECPFCSRVGPTIDQIKKSFGPEKVRIVWKHNPLPFHKEARPAHEAAATVFGIAGNDAFWKFHDLLFQNQRSLTPENFEKWAAQAGVDVAKFKTEYAAKKYASKVDEDLAMSRKVGATGTPAFRINGITLVGAQPFEKFKELIDQQLVEANKLIAGGTPKSQVYVDLCKKNASNPTPDAAKPEEKPQQPPEDTATWKVPLLPDDPIRGPKDALVTIVVFSDFECPFCKRVEPTVAQVVAKYGNDVRVVWKDNPLPFHKRAIPASVFARVAYKAKGDKGFWEAHDALFESQPKLEDADLEALAGKLGVPWAQVKAAMGDNRFQPKFDANVELGGDLNARGTPHFFVNGYRIQGAQPFEKFQEVMDAQLAKAKAVVAKGVARDKVYDEIMKDGKEPPPPEKRQIAAPGKDNPVKGPAGAKVTVQIFSDFQCPFCKRVEPTLAQLEQEFKDKVKFVWRHDPLPFHQDAPLASQAAQEVFVQKGSKAFWEYHDKLFESQDKPDGIKRANLEKIAESMGVDMAKFKAALDGNAHKAAIDADVAVAKDAKIDGTPAFAINGYFLSGAQPYPAFKRIVQRALKE
jgi:protein-disulfide isomerase